jgi:hypothetical protein
MGENMGWLISQDMSKAEQVAELVKGWSNEKGGCRFLAHSVRGNVLFAVGQNFERTKPERFEDRWIMVCLLRKDRGYGWGYKDMSERMGPYNFNCPLKYLAMAPEQCATWREGVRAYHEKRRKRSSETIEPGTVFQFAKGFKAAGESLDGAEAKILRKSGRGYIAQLEYSTIKVMRRHIGEVLFQTA